MLFSGKHGTRLLLLVAKCNAGSEGWARLIFKFLSLQNTDSFCFYVLTNFSLPLSGPWVCLFSSSLKLLVPKKEKSRKEGEVCLYTTRGSPSVFLPCPFLGSTKWRSEENSLQWGQSLLVSESPRDSGLEIVFKNLIFSLFSFWPSLMMTALPHALPKIWGGSFVIPSHSQCLR